MNRILRLIASGLVIPAVLSAALLATIELALFAIAGGAVPILPFYTDESGVPRLLPGVEQTVDFGSWGRHKYVTDSRGGRIADASFRGLDLNGGIHVVGDSQALGYGLPFESTFAALTAARIGNGVPVRILAAPSTDMELQTIGYCTDVPHLMGAPRLEILTLNMGNDLDEIYAGGRFQRGAASPQWKTFLMRHSRLYMRLQMIRSRQAVRSLPVPGVNLILFSLSSSERVVLAQAVIERIEEAVRCSPDASRLLVVLLPSDFQVDPEQLSKYRSFATSPETFDGWYERRHELAEMMNVLETLMMKRLLASGIDTVSFRDVARNSGLSSTVLFDDQSHHLTARGNALLADAIAGRLSPD